VIRRFGSAFSARDHLFDEYDGGCVEYCFCLGGGTIIWNIATSTLTINDDSRGGARTTNSDMYTAINHNKAMLSWVDQDEIF